MRRHIVSALALVCVLGLVGCQSKQATEQTEVKEADDGSASTQITTEKTANDFVMKLYADKSVYSTDEVIQIWATLEYVGEQDTFTIWHGDPYIVFTITDGADFNSNGFVHDVLTSSELQKGEVYHFDYVKSGGWDSQGPDADF